MAASLESIDRRLRKVAETQLLIVSAFGALERRIGDLGDDLGRANTAIYRMGLSGESAKNSLQRQEKALNDLASQIKSLKLAIGAE